MAKPEPRALSLSERLERFGKRNPAVFITAPWGTRSGNWEVSAPGRTAEAFDHGMRMMDVLEKRYPAQPDEGGQP
jgi:hypothetical protein